MEVLDNRVDILQIAQLQLLQIWKSDLGHDVLRESIPSIMERRFRESCEMDDSICRRQSFWNRVFLGTTRVQIDIRDVAKSQFLQLRTLTEDSNQG